MQMRGASRRVGGDSAGAGPSHVAALNPQDILGSERSGLSRWTPLQAKEAAEDLAKTVEDKLRPDFMEKVCVAAVKYGAGEFADQLMEQVASLHAARAKAASHSAVFCTVGDVALEQPWEELGEDLRQRMAHAEVRESEAGAREVQELRDFLHVVRHPDGELPATRSAELEDDDVEVKRNPFLPMNWTCPLTQKAVMELDEPVEDAKGYVYEGQALRDELRRGRGAIRSPVAGCAHQVTSATVKPSKCIERLRVCAAVGINLVRRNGDDQAIDIA